MLKKLAELLDAEIVDVTDDELVEIAQGRARTFLRSDIPMNAEAILGDHMQRDNRCTLVVCNTVLRAQTLYLALKHTEAHGTRIVLLHSRFTKNDRKRLSEEIEQALGPAQWKDGRYRGPDILVIATQVVEVGLNISVEVLHTENAPANSLIQRAGRCARFAQQQGRVVVYPLPTNEDGRAASTAPYDKKVCEATWDALGCFDNCVVGFREEQRLIDAVHTEEDTQLLAHYEENEHLILDSMFACLREGERGKAPELIRDVSQVQVLIHDDPNVAITRDPWQWESFGLRPDTLTKKKRWEWMRSYEQSCMQMHAIREQKDLPDKEDGLDNNQQLQTSYTWETVTNSAEIRKALLIALSSEVATYDSALGFLFRDDFPDYVPEQIYQSRYTQRENKKIFAPSHVTSYQQHITGLYSAYNMILRSHLAFVSHKLEHEMGLPKGMVEQAILLAIGCHDLGKLDKTWQQWAVAWQTLRYERKKEPYELPPPNYCFAKTDYDSDRRKDEYKWQYDVKPKRPHHSCESVAIGRPLLRASLGINKNAGIERMPVLRAICGAIARHHSAQASEYKAAELSLYAIQAADEALRVVSVQQDWSYDIGKLCKKVEKDDNLAAPSSGRASLTIPSYAEGRIYELETWLYFVIAHALRLADQRASQ